MHPLVQAFIVAATTFLAASTGFWGYLKNRRKISDDEHHQYNMLLMGLASTKIIERGMYYIERGCITKDEYDDLHRYLYRPYMQLGGNGTTERVMHAVQRLPLLGERFEKIGDTWRTIPIRESDPTGYRHADVEYDVPYNGPERRKQKQPIEGPDRRNDE